MPRKTRKELVEVDEQQVQIEREARYRQLERELHNAWQQGHGVHSPGAFPEVKAYPSAL